MVSWVLGCGQSDRPLVCCPGPRGLPGGPIIPGVMMSLRAVATGCWSALGQVPKAPQEQTGDEGQRADGFFWRGWHVSRGDGQGGHRQLCCSPHRQATHSVLGIRDPQNHPTWARGWDAGSPTPGAGVGASGTEERRWGLGQEVLTRPGDLGYSGGCCCRCLPGLATWGSSVRTRAKQEACLRPHCWGPAAAMRPLGCCP